jgi:hypothetical protein
MVADAAAVDDYDNNATRAAVNDDCTLVDWRM